MEHKYTHYQETGNAVKRKKRNREGGIFSSNLGTTTHSMVSLDSCQSCQFSNVVIYLLLSASGQGGQSLHSRFPISHWQDVGRQYRAIHDAKDLRDKTIPSQIMCTVR